MPPYRGPRRMHQKYKIFWALIALSMNPMAFKIINNCCWTVSGFDSDPHYQSLMLNHSHIPAPTIDVLLSKF